MRAKQLSISEQELHIILTKPYAIGTRGKMETLLHLAVANGNMDFINALMNHFNKIPNLSQLVNHKGNTLSHIAAENNRSLVLRKLTRMGADLTITNKKKETVYNIVQSPNYTACLPYCQPTTNSANSHEDEKTTSHRDTSQGGATKSTRDPHFPKFPRN